MPIYTYRCPEGHTWDEVRTIEGSEASEEPCPECTRAQSGQAIPAHGKKVPATGVSAHFKGTGWTPKFHPNQRGK